MVFFSLEENELGCTSQIKHQIKVTDSEPFKGRFCRILPPLLEEVRTHLNDELDAWATIPRNSPWKRIFILIFPWGKSILTNFFPPIEVGYNHVNT